MQRRVDPARFLSSLPQLSPLALMALNSASSLSPSTCVRPRCSAASTCARSSNVGATPNSCHQIDASSIIIIVFVAEQQCNPNLLVDNRRKLQIENDLHRRNNKASHVTVFVFLLFCHDPKLSIDRTYGIVDRHSEQRAHLSSTRNSSSKESLRCVWNLSTLPDYNT